MPFIWILLISVLIGYGIGGRLANIEHVRLKWTGLIILAIIIQIVIFLPFFDGALELKLLQTLLHFFSYALLLTSIIANRHFVGMYLIGVGMLLNCAVIFLNGGYMPVPIEHWVTAGFGELELFSSGTPIGNAILMTDATKLWFLGDILCIPMYPAPRLMSIGDVILGIGAMLLITQMMKSKKEEA
jgi:hypothetical protein